MSKEMDEMRKELRSIFYEVCLSSYTGTLVDRTRSLDDNVDIAIKEILSLETDTCRLAVVRKVAQLSEIPHVDSAYNFERGRADMLKDGFVREVKE